MEPWYLSSEVIYPYSHKPSTSQDPFDRRNYGYSWGEQFILVEMYQQLEGIGARVWRFVGVTFILTNYFICIFPQKTFLVHFIFLQVYIQQRPSSSSIDFWRAAIIHSPSSLRCFCLHGVDISTIQVWGFLGLFPPPRYSELTTSHDWVKTNILLAKSSSLAAITKSYLYFCYNSGYNPLWSPSTLNLNQSPISHVSLN